MRLISAWLRPQVERFTDRLGPAGSGVAMIAVGSAVGQAVVVLGTLVLARFFGPSAFGIFSWIGTLIMVLALVAALRLELAIPLADSDDATRGVITVALALAGVSSIVLTAITPFAGPWIDDLSALDLMPYLYFLGPTVLATAIMAIYSQCLVRERTYGAIGWRNTTSGVVTVVAQFAGGLLSSSAGWLLFGQLFARTMVCFQLARAVSVKPNWGFLPRYREVFRRFWRFPVFFTPAAILNTVGGQLPLLLTGLWYGAVEAGYVGMAWRILALPIALLGLAVSNVFVGEFARARLSEPARCMPMYKRALRKLLPIGVVTSVIAVLASPFCFAFVLGPEWAAAGQVAQVVAPAIGAAFVAGPLRQALTVGEWYVTSMALDAARLVATGAVGWAIHSAGGSYLMALAGMSGALFAVYSLEVVISWRATSRIAAGGDPQRDQ